MEDRARRCVYLFGILFLAAFSVAGIWQAYGIEGYLVLSMPDPGGVITPLDKRVEVAAGAWMANFKFYPAMILAPVSVYFGALAAISLCRAGRPGIGFVFSGISLAVVIFLPIVLAYTSWVYRVMRGKVTEAQIEKDTHSAY